MIQANLGQGPIFYTDASLNGYGLWSCTEWQAGYFITSVNPKGHSAEWSLSLFVCIIFIQEDIISSWYKWHLSEDKIR